MDVALGFLMFLWALFGRSRTTPELAPRLLPSRGGASRGTPVSTAPWPAVVPSGLPPFPGSGWEPDEPPPQAVQRRAGELLSSLWAKGKGSSKLEQTAGRWIAYQAGITAGNKHGVIAYRQKRAVAPAARGAPAARPAATPAPARRPAPAAVPAPMSMPPGSVRVEVPGGAIITTPSALNLPTLKYGRGLKPAAPDQDVVLLQQKLGITPDGRFGADTRTAVTNFQAKQVNAQRPGWSLKDIDGIVGPQTWTALFAVRA